jgi:predicted DNA-binding protein
MSKIEAFIGEALAKEITEFQEDRNDVVETKVRLVKEARSQFDELKKKFVQTSATLVKESVSNHLNAEITQLREDIESAKASSFGRKIFEAYASEFSASHLNENQEIKDLQQAVAEKDEALIKAQAEAAEKSHIIESKETEIAAINESAERKEAMVDLLKPLNKEKGAVMRDLLESVQTSKLKSAYDRYLPVVLDGKAPKPQAEKQMVSESRVAVTGNKEEKQATPAEADNSNIVELRKLAGLK